MNKAWAILFLAVSHISSLEIGSRYDFICSDGQDIYNAELVLEDRERYFVRLSPVMSQVPIEKKFVTETRLRSAAANKVPRHFMLTTSAGADFPNGRLAGFAAYAPAISFAGNYSLTPKAHAVIRADAEQLSRASAYLRAFSFMGGLIYELPVSFSNLGFYTGLAGGATWLNAKASTLSENTWVPGALGWLRVRYSISARLHFYLDASLRYIYDSDTLLLLPGAMLGIGWMI